MEWEDYIAIGIVVIVAAVMVLFFFNIITESNEKTDLRNSFCEEQFSRHYQDFCVQNDSIKEFACDYENEKCYWITPGGN